MTTAADILRKGAQHIEDRAAMRDQPEGERSMARTVGAFNALTGHTLTERDGWLFMVALKMARACNTPTGHPDDYEDLAAYAALAGESVAVAGAPGNVGPETDTWVHISCPRPIPKVCRYAAQDLDGEWYGYTSAPTPWATGWSALGNYYWAGAAPNWNWRGTLICRDAGAVDRDAPQAVPGAPGSVGPWTDTWTHISCPWPIPNVYRYAAQNADGEWRAYTCKPIMVDSGWHPWEAHERLGTTRRNPDWRDTLIRCDGVHP